MVFLGERGVTVGTIGDGSGRSRTVPNRINHLAPLIPLLLIFKYKSGPPDRLDDHGVTRVFLNLLPEMADMHI